ncbi:hypothetical protein GCM10023191_028830 [Actinoallomurus oryzae]|uniref:Uncharacterized protein n=1 Tax=Actinoallomurus oryzae TaxID=502180 RepID=A0ABP8PVD2_9ACTN
MRADVTRTRNLVSPLRTVPTRAGLADGEAEGERLGVVAVRPAVTGRLSAEPPHPAVEARTTAASETINRRMP